MAKSKKEQAWKRLYELSTGGNDVDACEYFSLYVSRGDNDAIFVSVPESYYCYGADEEVSHEFIHALSDFLKTCEEEKKTTS